MAQFGSEDVVGNYFEDQNRETSVAARFFKPQ